MIKKVHIKNFKTLKDLAFPCTRMNLFIGDTNAGKSNLLEALTLLSRGALQQRMFDQRLIRYEEFEELFPLRDLSEPMLVAADGLQLRINYEQGRFRAVVSERKGTKGKLGEVASTYVDPRGMIDDNAFQFTTYIRRYQFLPDLVFGANIMKEMEAPYGANLPGLLASNRKLRSELSKILEGTGLRLEVSLKENKIRLSQLTDENIVVTLPYRNLSDTIKRYVFIYAILGTVKGFTLLFDEPEQNTFPFYTKHMAEMMALDNGNQYFITTHNEYLFRSVVEKTKVKDLSVFITYLNADGNTALKRLAPKELGELLDMDVFFNIDRFLPE
ncbi:MAG: AAA family ATPase [Flavobacteriales bacterium]|nr:AAA family ATPase [Flavobacteriales bacterium]